MVSPPKTPPSTPHPPSTTPAGTVTYPPPSRGEIYWAKIPKRHTVGSEQYKRRPWLIISSNVTASFRMVIGVPLSFQVHKGNRHFRIRVLATDIIADSGSTLDPGDRIALTEQIRALSVERLEFPRQGKVTDTALFAVEAGIAFILDLP